MPYMAPSVPHQPELLLLQRMLHMMECIISTILHHPLVFDPLPGQQYFTDQNSNRLFVQFRNAAPPGTTDARPHPRSLPPPVLTRFSRFTWLLPLHRSALSLSFSTLSSTRVSSHTIPPTDRRTPTAHVLVPENNALLLSHGTFHFSSTATTPPHLPLPLRLLSLLRPITSSPSTTTCGVFPHPLLLVILWTQRHPLTAGGLFTAIGDPHPCFGTIYAF